jgi:hypothetical protein
MAEIWYLVTSVIYVYHIVGSVFGPVRFLLPVCWLSWFLYTLNIYVHFCHIFLSNYWWQKSDIWSQASYRYKCTPYCGKRFWTHQIPTSCLPILLIFIHIEHTFVYAHFSSHFSKQLLMTGIWYLVTSFI